ncbi:hypothetical protein KQ51_01085 [Candidatus Izimaplasma bacterium HR1]|uniref:hypothetical protein n=1 Tax=Candidatus Izimoplasma sp. HR1 TaxID=1541959 RepID=UPI0004F6F9B2|nr:hypothetical protein KQ51_01085 [Candidatus Izimaplasma bacterium HR1]
MSRIENNLIDRSSKYFSKYKKSNGDLSKEELNLIITVEPIQLIRKMAKASKNNSDYGEIKSGDIPQFSKLKHCGFDLVHRLAKLDFCYGFTYDEIGEIYLDDDHKQLAYKKYGENHAKTAEMFGLIFIDRGTRPHKSYLTNLGKLISENEYSIIDLVLTNTIITSSFFRYILVKAYFEDVSVSKEIDFLALETIKRRLPNIFGVLKFIEDNSNGIEFIIDSINK